MRKVMKAVSLAMLILGIAAVSAFADNEAKSRSLFAADATGHWTIGAGYMLPNEGDLDGGALAGIGWRLSKDGDNLTVDLMHSYTDLSSGVVLPGLDDDVKHTIVQFGYLHDLQNHERFSVGGGIQVHEMNLTNIARRSKTTVFGMAEYDFTDRWTARAESAIYAKEDTIRFGTNFIFMLMYNL